MNVRGRSSLQINSRWTRGRLRHKGRNAVNRYYGKKVEGRNRTVSSNGFAVNLGVQPILTRRRRVTNGVHMPLRIHDRQSVTAFFDRLRQPDYLGLLSQTQRFCVPVSRQVCLYRSNHFKELCCSARKERALYYTGLTSVCQCLTFLGHFDGLKVRRERFRK